MKISNYTIPPQHVRMSDTSFACNKIIAYLYNIKMGIAPLV